MDKNKKNNTPITKFISPAQLRIGSADQTLNAVEEFLQSILCTYNNCNVCKSCIQIRERQHHALMWLYPEKNYTLEQFDDLFTTLSFQLQPDEHFFFIIQKADFLTTMCANKLLKSMEEPPTGYHFILLAENKEQILPTIQSRCIIHTLNSSSMLYTQHPFFEIFTTKTVSCQEFSKILDTTPINERESIEIVNQIIHYWMIQYQNQNKNTPTKNSPLSLLITQLQQAQLFLPMPGSCILFWRNLYLQTQSTLTLLVKY